MQRGFWADSINDGGMTAADLDNLISDGKRSDWQPRNIWRHVLETTSNFSARKEGTVAGDVSAHTTTSAAEDSNTALVCPHLFITSLV